MTLRSKPVTVDQLSFLNRELRRAHERRRNEALRSVPIIKHLLLPLNTHPFDLHHWPFRKTSNVLAREIAWCLAFSWPSLTRAFSGTWFKLCTGPVVVLSAFATFAHVVRPWGVTVTPESLPLSVIVGLVGGACSLVAFLVHFFCCPPACLRHARGANDEPTESDLQQLRFELRAFVSEQLVPLPAPAADRATQSPALDQKTILGPIRIDVHEIGFVDVMRNYLLVLLARVAEASGGNLWQSKEDGTGYEQFNSSGRILFGPKLLLPRIWHSNLSIKRKISELGVHDIVVEWTKPASIEGHRIDPEFLDRTAAETGVDAIVDVSSYSTTNRFFSEWQQFTRPFARLTCRLLMAVAALLSISVISARILEFLFGRY